MVKKRNRIIHLLFSILIVFVFISSIFLLSFSKRESNYFKSVEAYFLCVKAKLTESENYEETNKVKRLGGAGTLLIYKNINYIILGVYFKIDDAKLVKEQNKKLYDNLEIVSLQSKTIPYNLQRKIKSNHNVFLLLKQMFEFLTNCYAIQKDFLAGEITQSKFLSKFFKMKIEFERQFNDISVLYGEDVYFSLIIECAKAYLSEADLMLTKFYDSDNKSNVLFSFLSNCVMYNYEMFDNF